MSGNVELQPLGSGGAGSSSNNNSGGLANFSGGTSLRKRFSKSGDGPSGASRVENLRRLGASSSGNSSSVYGGTVPLGGGGSSQNNAGQNGAATAGPGAFGSSRLVSPLGRQAMESAFVSRNDGMQQLPLLESSLKNQQNASIDVRAKLEEYQDAVEILRGRSGGSASTRRTSWAFMSLIMVILPVLVIVVIYLFTRDNTSETSVSVREICNTEDLEVCLEGLVAQLRDDSTAALRSPIHYLFTFGAIAVTFLLYGCLYKRRRLVRQRLLASLPNNSIDLWTGHRKGSRRPYQTTPFNSEMYICIFECLQRAVLARNIQLIVAENEVMQGNTPSQDLNWGYVDSAGVGRKGMGKLSRVNFKRYTAKSYEFVSELAARENPAYQIHSWETVRDYMGRLKTLCKPPDCSFAISERRCDEFVALYEEARFSPATFDTAKWDLVRQNLHYFHQYFAPQQ